jgi:hypothetical protein
VVRFGAVGDAQDFRYLVDGEGEHSVICEHTINRLAAGIHRAANHGIKVIIALGHVPGRIFAQDEEQYDFRLWCSPEYGDRVAALWGTLARSLRHFENVVGYLDDQIRAGRPDEPRAGVDIHAVERVSGRGSMPIISRLRPARQATLFRSALARGHCRGLPTLRTG